MAVFTPVPPADLEHFLRSYDLGRLRASEGITEGWENTNYRLETDKGRFVLTLYEHLGDQTLPFILGLAGHLADAGLPVPRPVRRRDGRVQGTLAGRPASVVRFLDGRWPREPSPAQCREGGRVLAWFHQAAAGFPRAPENVAGPKAWLEWFTRVKSRADSVAVGLEEEIDAELADVSARWPVGLPRGVIHGDLFPDNTLFEGENITGLIDFSLACREAWLFDVAVCVNAWGFEAQGRFRPERARAFLDGYNVVRPFTGEEAQALPVMARGTALRFLISRLVSWLDRDPDALVDPKDPLEYLERVRFHRGVTDARIYGLE